jgi:two-component system cell cycle response regulator CtrA
MRVLLGCGAKDRTSLGRLLGVDGHVVDIVDQYEDLASSALHSGPYDVVVVSVSDARGQGAQVVRELRRRGVKQPVVMLAPHVLAEDEGTLLDLGADDVLSGPVSASVLAARLRLALRRTLGHASSLLVCGNVVVDQAHQTVTVDGRLADITRREFAVLETLMLRRGMLLTKEHFMSQLYGDEDGPDARIVDVFVCKLRRKLAAAGAAEIVRTSWGRGYVVEEPGPAAIAAARARYAAGVPRTRRAHLAPRTDLGLAAV